MNRKRIEKILHNCSKTIDESVNRVGTSNEIVKYIEDLEQQCKKQKECIDKLKEYISSQMIFYDDGEDCGVDCECDGFKLLDILKEVE